MQNPPLHLKSTITFSNLPVGTGASAMGGGFSRIGGDVVAVIVGDEDRVFSVMRMEALGLIHEPDAPPGSGRSWQPVFAADGAGPFPIGKGGALAVTVNIAVPNAASVKPSYAAVVDIVLAGTTGPAALRISIQATVDLIGSVQISAAGGPLLNGILAGQTENMVAYLESTLQQDTTGTFSLLPGHPEFSANPVAVSLPAGSTQTVTLAVTCAAGTAAGLVPGVVFGFACSNSAGNSHLEIEMLRVLAPRAIFPVTTDLPPVITLAPGSSTPFKVTAFDSGGYNEILFQGSPWPAGVNLVLGAVRTIGGGVVPGEERITELDAIIQVSPQTPGLAAGDPPILLQWTVAADGTHPELNGAVPIMANILVPPPQDGLASNSNYFLVDGGNPLFGVQVTVGIGTDLVSTANGWAIQLNACSVLGHATAWQQFVVAANPTTGQIICTIETYDEDYKLVFSTPDGVLAASGTTLPAGYSVSIQLSNDSNGDILSAVFTLTDGQGRRIGSLTQAITANTAPICALQVNIVAWGAGKIATLSSGSGTITYSATKSLTVLNSRPSLYTAPGLITETSNVAYGLMAAMNNAPQTFQLS